MHTFVGSQPFFLSTSNSHFRTIESPGESSRRDAKWQSLLLLLPLSPRPYSRSRPRSRDKGTAERRTRWPTARSACVPPPSSGGPSIFKSSSLAKRAGGRRVFLSRRKITHCPLLVVPLLSSFFHLLSGRWPPSLVRFS